MYRIPMQQILNDCVESNETDSGYKMNGTRKNEANNKDVPQSIENIMKMVDAFWDEDDKQEYNSRFIL